VAVWIADDIGDAPTADGAASTDKGSASNSAVQAVTTNFNITSSMTSVMPAYDGNKVAML